ncbi:phage holin, LLH family [Jeotgalibaca porci]|uniref:phage holin, LLH family n=1 Tax=Jeotgalibaca porci TaxID=1868793 RepID=UPI0035A1B7C1
MPTEFSDILVESAMAILVALVGWITREAVAYFKKKGLTEILSQKQYLVDIGVRSIEQIYINEDGPKKLEKAKITALELLSKNGIEITQAELDNFIESSVNAMNEAKKSVEPEQVIVSEAIKSIETKGEIHP